MAETGSGWRVAGGGRAQQENGLHATICMVVTRAWRGRNAYIMGGCMHGDDGMMMMMVRGCLRSTRTKRSAPKGAGQWRGGQPRKSSEKVRGRGSEPEGPRPAYK